MEIMNLLSTVFSDYGASFNQPFAFHSLPGARLGEESKDPAYLKRVAIRKEFENKKKEYQTAPENKEKIVSVAQNLLPRIFFVYESTINP